MVSDFPNHLSTTPETDQETVQEEFKQCILIAGNSYL